MILCKPKLVIRSLTCQHNFWCMDSSFFIILLSSLLSTVFDNIKSTFRIFNKNNQFPLPYKGFFYESWLHGIWTLNCSNNFFMFRYRWMFKQSGEMWVFLCQYGWQLPLCVSKRIQTSLQREKLSRWVNAFLLITVPVTPLIWSF